MSTVFFHEPASVATGLWAEQYDERRRRLLRRDGLTVAQVAELKRMGRFVPGQRVRKASLEYLWQTECMLRTLARLGDQAHMRCRHCTTGKVYKKGMTACKECRISKEAT